MAPKVRGTAPYSVIAVENVPLVPPFPSARRVPLPSGLATSVVFLASGAVLVLEVVGLRLVGPYLGVTLQTSSAVIGVALGAIAYGCLLYTSDAADE